LCGGFHDEVRRQISPLENPDIADFCTALRELVSERQSRGQRVGLIASVDLSHVGSRFGDESELSDDKLRAIEIADRKFLACADLGSADALHAHIAQDNNARNVDAHPALYTLLAAFPELRAQLLEYAQAYDEAANSVVSFASMTIYEAK
jgi:predicted class III extradiol MEMO1 family dioxygenase